MELILWALLALFVVLLVGLAWWVVLRTRRRRAHALMLAWRREHRAWDDPRWQEIMGLR